MYSFQLLTYSVNKHAEELRNHFVTHKEKKELRVDAVGSRYTVDFGRMAVQMSKQIHENVRIPVQPPCDPNAQVAVVRS